MRWGTRAWVVTFDGSEQHGTLVSFTASHLVLRVENKDITIPATAIARVEVPAALDGGAHTGLKIGLFVGLVGGVALTSGSIPWRALIGVESAAGGAIVGGGLGAFVSKLHDRRQTLYATQGETMSAGTHVWIQTTDGRSMDGSLVSFSPAVLELRRSGVVTRVATAELERVEIRRSPWPRMVKGAILGAVTGGVVAFTVNLGPCKSSGQATFCSPSIPNNERDSVSTGLKLTFTGAGALFGLSAGAFSHGQRDTVYATERGNQVDWHVQVLPLLIGGHPGVVAAAARRW
jgi:hypothetical protein